MINCVSRLLSRLLFVDPNHRALQNKSRLSTCIEINNQNALIRWFSLRIGKAALTCVELQGDQKCYTNIKYSFSVLFHIRPRILVYALHHILVLNVVGNGTELVVSKAITRMQVWLLELYRDSQHYDRLYKYFTVTSTHL